MSSSPPIPIIPLTSPTLGPDIVSAARKPGFFYLSSHSLSPSLLDRVFEASERFFLDESTESMREKDKSVDRKGNTGWTKIQNERLDPSNPLAAADLKESFYLAPSSPTHPLHPPPPQTLPPRLNQSKVDIDEMQSECRRICSSVLKAFEEGLGLKEGTFTDSHHHAHDRLRLIHYPPTPVASASSSSEQKGLAIRAGSHSDYGSITLLFQRDVGGLQVLFDGLDGGLDAASGQGSTSEGHGRGKGRGKWVDIPPVEGCIVVNVGDAMEFWTAGYLASTQHRVVLPRQESEAGSRFSIAYFHQPDEDAILCPLSLSPPSAEADVSQDRSQSSDRAAGGARERFAVIARAKGVQDPSKPITGGEHLRARLRATYG